MEKLQSDQFDNQSKEFIEGIEELTKKLNQLTDEYVRNSNDYSNMVNQKLRQFRQPNSQLVYLNRKQRLLNKCLKISNIYIPQLVKSSLNRWQPALE